MTRETDEPRDDPPEDPLHYTVRMDEVEPELGRRGKWTFLLQVLVWVIVLAIVVIGYALMGRSI
jgi:hypothetical protein